VTIIVRCKMNNFGINLPLAL